jgi:hypothetical protein
MAKLRNRTNRKKEMDMTTTNNSTDLKAIILELLDSDEDLSGSLSADWNWAPEEAMKSRIEFADKVVERFKFTPPTHTGSCPLCGTEGIGKAEPEPEPKAVNTWTDNENCAWILYDDGSRRKMAEVTGEWDAAETHEFLNLVAQSMTFANRQYWNENCDNAIQTIVTRAPISAHPFVGIPHAPNSKPIKVCSSCGERRSNSIHDWENEAGR